MRLPGNIDHIIYIVAELEAGVDEIANLLGVRAARGGRHPDFGTHNALLSLGPATYLEIIAPDPTLRAPRRGMPFGIAANRMSRLATWALAVEDIQAIAEAAITTGVNVGALEAGSRIAPDGTVLSWRLSDPNAMSFDGALPFLISWSDTPHPAATAPCGGEITGIRIEHPEADKLRKALLSLGVDSEVKRADTFSLIATIKTDHRIVELR